MVVRSVENSDLGIVAAWLAQKENYQWLDFGNGNQLVSPVLLRFMIQRNSNAFRVFTSDSGEAPIGIVALGNVSRNFKTAMLWYVLGDKRFSGGGYTTRAVSAMLSFAFTDLELRAVNAWAVDQNDPSIRVLERNRFRLVGRQRQCHYVDGRAFDRLLFDTLASEHEAR